MKKILFLFILAVFIFNKSQIKVEAQINDFLVPGVNCGVAGDIKTSKCCAPMLPFSFADGGNLSGFFSVIRDWIVGTGMKLVKKYTDPLEEYQSKVIVPCQTGVPSTPGDSSNINCRCTFDGLSPTPAPLEVLKVYCDNQTRTSDQTECTTCYQGGGVWTGMGCVQGSMDRFISQTVFGWGVGLAGGMSLLCIIYAAFMMQSSQGNPEKLKKAQELITSCVMGLMLIIFSVFILKLIGVQIIKIPGLG